MTEVAQRIEDEDFWRWYELSDGRKVPSVTKVLEIIQTERMTSYMRKNSEAKQLRVLKETGNIGHEIEEIVTNDLMNIPQTVPPHYTKHFENWLALKEKHKIRGILSQRLIASEKYGYAGTLDIYGYIHNKLAIFDVKSGYVSKKAALQEAAYAQAMAETSKTKLEDYELVTIPVHRDGTFRDLLITEHKESCLLAFFDALQAFKHHYWSKCEKMDYQWLKIRAHETYYKEKWGI